MVSSSVAIQLFMAVIVGVAAGILTYKAGKPAPAAVLAGGAAFGAAVIWLGQVVSN